MSKEEAEVCGCRPSSSLAERASGSVPSHPTGRSRWWRSWGSPSWGTSCSGCRHKGSLISLWPVDTATMAAFREEPELPYWLNAGIDVLSREIGPLLPDQGDHEDTTFPRLAAERRLGAYKSRSYWRAVDTVKDLSEIQKDLEQRLLTSFLA